MWLVPRWRMDCLQGIWLPCARWFAFLLESSSCGLALARCGRQISWRKSRAFQLNLLERKKKNRLRIEAVLLFSGWSSAVLRPVWLALPGCRPRDRDLFCARVSFPTLTQVVRNKGSPPQHGVSCLIAQTLYLRKPSSKRRYSMAPKANKWSSVTYTLNIVYLSQQPHA